MKNLDVLDLDKTKIEGVVNGLNQLLACLLYTSDAADEQ